MGSCSPYYLWLVCAVARGAARHARLSLFFGNAQANGVGPSSQSRPRNTGALHLVGDTFSTRLGFSEHSSQAVGLVACLQLGPLRRSIHPCSHRRSTWAPIFIYLWQKLHGAQKSFRYWVGFYQIPAGIFLGGECNKPVSSLFRRESTRSCSPYLG